MKCAAPAPKPGQDHLDERQDRYDDRNDSGALVRKPGDQRNDEKEQRPGKVRKNPSAR